MDAFATERRRTAVLALILSAGLHLIALLTLQLSPGAWRHGLKPALSVVLKPLPAVAAGNLLGNGRAPVPAADSHPASRGTGLGARESTPTRESGGKAPVAQTGSRVRLPDHYFRRTEVDVPAQALVHGPLVFPENALLWRLAGIVRARVYINDTGTVDSVQILEAIPPGQFEEAARTALRQVRYQPAQIGGRPVKSQKVIEVKFDPYEGSAQAPRSAQ